jgi:hypothetical protein
VNEPHSSLLWFKNTPDSRPWLSNAVSD